MPHRLDPSSLRMLTGSIVGFLPTLKSLSIGAGMDRETRPDVAAFLLSVMASLPGLEVLKTPMVLQIFPAAETEEPPGVQEVSLSGNGGVQQGSSR